MFSSLFTLILPESQLGSVDKARQPICLSEPGIILLQRQNFPTSRLATPRYA